MPDISKKRLEIVELLSAKTDDEITQMMNNMNMLMSYYRCAMLEIETKFRVLDEQFSLEHERNPIESIKSRLKSFPSIREKLSRKDLPLNVVSIEDNLNDIAGVRVICSFIDDIYMLADCLIKQDDVKLVRMKDYIKEPKSNGYRSLHLIVEIPIFLCEEKRIVKVEVQLRTIAMETWARLEHRMRYKKNLDDELLKKTSDELLQCAEISNLLDVKMQELRKEIEGK